MKKLVTREERGRKETRNKIIIGILLVVLMVLSTAGYAFFSNSEERITKIEYNGIEFTLGENGLWRFEIQGFEFLTYYSPQETENISVFTFRTVNDYSGKPLFFIGEGLARREIEFNLRNFVLRSQDGCLKDYEELCKEDAPLKNCSDSNMIILKETEEIKISQEENCIFIEAPPEEQTRAIDALLYKILGVRTF